MLLIPLVLISVLQLLEREDLRIHHRVDIISFDRGVHSLELLPRSHQQTANGADVGQRIEHGGLRFGLETTHETDDADHTLELDGGQGVGHGVGAADLDDVVHADAAGQLLRGLTPLGIFLVVDDVVCSQLLQFLALLGGGCGRDDAGAGGLGELHLHDRQSFAITMRIVTRVLKLTCTANTETPPVPCVKTH